MRQTISLFLLLVTAPVFAADPWSKADKTREAIYLTLHVVDWGQSLDIAKNPQLYTEGNHILGEHPSVKRVNAYFATTALLHAGIVHVLPSRYRPAFQYFWIGVEAGVVALNYKAGLKVNF